MTARVAATVAERRVADTVAGMTESISAALTIARNVLGVTADATAADIRASQRRMARASHPDFDGGDPALFRLVILSAEVLIADLNKQPFQASTIRALTCANAETTQSRPKASPDRRWITTTSTETRTPSVDVYM